MDHSKFILWQINLWDRFAKLSPFIISISSIVFYYLGYNDWHLVIGICATLAISIAIIWWFWVIYTMASIVIILNNSGKSMEEVIKELRDIKDTISKEKEKL